MIGGLPRLRTGVIEGPYNVTGVSSTPSRERIFVCRRRGRLAGGRVRRPRSSRTWRAAPTGGRSRRPTSRRRSRSTSRRAERRQLRRRHPRGRRAHPGQPVVPVPHRARPGQRCRRAPRTASATSSWPRACRSSCGAASRTRQLLNLAIAGRLREPGVLAGAGAAHDRRRARRRAGRATSPGSGCSCATWRRRSSPDLLMFPDFDDNIRKALPQRNRDASSAHILRENRSALELLSADYTFLNERLAKHYGIPGVYGERFRQVKLTDPNRRGLLGQGSILSLTSVATRTSPVFRGKYVLTTFLNTPPPPPPPNVPTLEESNKARRPRRRRCAQQLELHRANPAVRVVPSRHRSAGLRARELQLGRAVARRRRRRRADRRGRRAGGRHQGRRPGRAARGAS